MHRTESRPSKVLRGVLIGVAIVAVLYSLLLIPEPKPPSLAAARQQPFTWNQDQFWAHLEHDFLQARAAGCAATGPQIAETLGQLDLLVQQLSTNRLSPDHAAFAALETNLFKAAPLVAACPERLSKYAALVSRLRAEVKLQSEQWDLASPQVRKTLYRLLAGSRAALEEATLQAPPDAQLETSLGTAEPSAGPSVIVRGVKFYSGDILLSRGGAPTSALIARGNDYPGSFSHVALLHVSQSGEASVIESHIESGVVPATFRQYLADKKLRILVLRLRADLPACQRNPMLPHEVATQALAEARQQHIPYDFTMNYQENSARFCSEVVSVAYQHANVHLWMGISYISSPTVVAWLGSFGARHFETQEPADLEYDPQLRVVAEWRDGATLFKAHIDDAVTDVMLEEAQAGHPLPYNNWLLPVTRIIKAYSALLNRFGKVATIPEGLSATAALRVKKYRQDHAAIADRLTRLADEFKLAKGYTPPYWELIKLARRACKELKNQH